MRGFLNRCMHRYHPWLKIKYLFSPRKYKTDKELIPENTFYCYDEKGSCPFIKRIETKRNNHAFSPFNGFRWCTFLNTGDYPDLNDRCKICNISIPDLEEDK